MPTYDYKCSQCDYTESRLQTIAQYIRAPSRPTCTQHGATMERKLSVVPGAAIGNSLAGDRHYDGMRATDGTDISSRAKHREYMKANNLTTADDFKGTWANAAAERASIRSGMTHDTSVRTDIVSAIQSKTA